MPDAMRPAYRVTWLLLLIFALLTVLYTLTIARYSGKTLAYTLIPSIAIPILLLAQAPRFRNPAAPSRP